MPLRVNEFGEYEGDDQDQQDTPEAPVFPKVSAGGGAPKPQPMQNQATPAAPKAASDFPMPPPTAGYDRAALSAGIQGIQFGGGNTTYNPSKYIADNQGGFAKGVEMVGTDKIRLPDGEIVDIGGNIDASGMGKAWWGSDKDWQAGIGAGGGGGQGAPSAIGGAPAGAGAAGTGAGAGAGAASPFGDEIHKAIMALLGRGSQPVTRESLAGQFDPISRQMQKGATRAREGAAERLAFQGQNQGGQGGALDTTVNSINEELAGKESALMAQMTGQELQARRDDVNNAIQFAQGEERRALQLQLAEMDKQLRQEGMGIQRQGLDLEGQRMGQQNQQFYDNMGYNMGRDEYVFNELYNQGLGS